MTSLVNSQAGKKNNFFYEEYIEKKFRILDSIEKKKEKLSKRWTFKNCLRIVNEVDCFFTSKKIFEGLKSKFSSEEIDSIISISQYRNSKTWMINVKENTFEGLIGRSLEIDGQPVTLEDANSNEYLDRSYLDKPVTATAIFRLDWLPHTLNDSEIKGFFYHQEIDSFEILNIEREFYKEEDMKKIENGVRRIKFKYDILDHNLILNLIGVHRFDDPVKRISSQLSFLFYFGHLSKNCAEKDKSCSNCHNLGHDSDQCTLANRIKNKKYEDSNDNYIEESKDPNQDQINREPRINQNSQISSLTFDQ